MHVLLDFSGIIISDALAYSSREKVKINLDILRHIVLKNIMYFKKKFSVSNENLYICFDGHKYWRKDIFPYYKQNRKLSHDASTTFDWNEFFVFFNTIKYELTNDLPFKTLEVNHCEADDIIAVLCQILNPLKEPIIIVSSDKDLIQIQQNMCSNVKQWSPFHKKFITPKTNQYNLFEHIVRGDSSDGIPNIVSDDDVFVTTKRQKPIKADSVIQWEKVGNITEPEKFCTGIMIDKFKRNLKLIDLRMIPEQQSKDIRNAYENCSCSKVDVFKYLVKHKLRKIMEAGGL